MSTQTLDNQIDKLIENYMETLSKCFNNYQIDLQSPMNTVVYFQDFYELLHQLSQRLSFDFIMETYQQCLMKSFINFNQKLKSSLQSGSKSINVTENQSFMAMIQNLLNYWSQFRRNVLQFMKLSFQSIERRQQQQYLSNRSKYIEYRPMMIDELTIATFVEIFFDQLSSDNESLLSDYWKQFINEFIIVNHRKMYEFIIENQLNFYRKSNEWLRLNLAHINHSLLLDDYRNNLLKKLLNMLQELDLCVYYKIFLIPFLSKNCQDRFSNKFHDFLIEISDNLLSNGTKPIEYLYVCRDFIDIQSYYNRNSIELLPDSIKIIKLFTIEFLLFRKFDQLFSDSANIGTFTQLLQQSNHEKLQEFCQCLLDIFNQAQNQGTQEKQSVEYRRLLRYLLKFFQNYFHKRLETLSRTFNQNISTKINRRNSIDYCEQCLDEHLNMNYRIIMEIFSTNKDFRQKFQTILNNYYYDIMKINSQTSQSFAYYSNDLLLKHSFIMAKSIVAKRMNDNGELRINLFKIFIENLIEYMKDINQYFDYCKHYFIQRLLHNLSYFNVEMEMNLLEMMNDKIRKTYQLQNSATTTAPSHRDRQKFLQNLNDFNIILEDFRNSTKKFNPNQCKSLKNYRKYLKMLPSKNIILNAGKWKLSNYDYSYGLRSVMLSKYSTISLDKSFDTLQLLYRKQFNDQLLYLNTKYSTIDCIMHGFEGDDNLDESLRFTVSLHQYLILNQFNSENCLTYELIKQNCEIQKQINLNISLLSLIYCGMIEPILLPDQSMCNGSLGSIKFQLNDLRFVTANLRNEYSKVAFKLYHYEYIDFNDPQNQSLNTKIIKIYPRIVSLLTDSIDLQYQLSTLSVEECNLTDILNSNVINNNPTMEQDDSSSLNDPLLTPLRRPLRLWNSHSQSSSSFSTPQQSQSRSSTLTIESPNHLDLNFKIDATLVRVMKRLRYLPNITAVYHAFRMEFMNSWRKYQPSTPLMMKINDIRNSSTPNIQASSIMELISLNDVQSRLLQLIDKHYIRRTDDGGFEYMIE